MILVDCTSVWGSGLYAYRYTNAAPCRSILGNEIVALGLRTAEDFARQTLKGDVGW